MKLARISLIVAASILVPGTYAPFPPGHHANFGNPIIEPIWQLFDEETQKEVYNEWLMYEPMKKALRDYVDKRDRRVLADGVAWQALKSLLLAKLKELRDAILDDEQAPTWSDVIEGEDPAKETVKTEARYLPKTQIKWQKFQTAFQHAVYLRLAEKRALYQDLLERFRLTGKMKSAWQRKIFRAKDRLEETYSNKLDRFRDALFQLRLKGDQL